MLSLCTLLNTNLCTYKIAENCSGFQGPFSRQLAMWHRLPAEVEAPQAAPVPAAVAALASVSVWLVCLAALGTRPGTRTEHDELSRSSCCGCGCMWFRRFRLHLHTFKINASKQAVANWQKNLKPAAVKKKYTCPRQAERGRQTKRERERQRDRNGATRLEAVKFSTCVASGHNLQKAAHKLWLRSFFLTQLEKLRMWLSQRQKERERNREGERKRMRQRVCEV